MDARKDNLVLAEQIVFTGFEFLDFGYEIAVCIDFFFRIVEFCPFCRIGLISKTGFFTGAVLDIDLIAVLDQGGNFGRRGNHAVFPVFDVLQDPKLHKNSSLWYVELV